MLSFISGSTQGIGLKVAQNLIASGHKVVAHARTKARADETKDVLDGAYHTVVADLTDPSQVVDLTKELNELGEFESIIHNAAIGPSVDKFTPTESGVCSTMQANVLAPFAITALTNRAQKYVWTSHFPFASTKVNMDDFAWTERKWNGEKSYIESKFYDAALGLAIANLWPDVYSNVVDPGWVKTRLGGGQASDTLDLAHETQIWLADRQNSSTGGFYYHKELKDPGKTLRNPVMHSDLIKLCEEYTGIEI